MCLALSKEEQVLKVAEKDILCYKVLELKEEDSKSEKFIGNVVTLFMYARLPVSGVLNANTPFPKLDDLKKLIFNYKQVTEGVIHCYKYFKGAKNIVDIIVRSEKHSHDYIIIEVTIKKGTRYYENAECIAAERIYYDPIILKSKIKEHLDTK